MFPVSESAFAPNGGGVFSSKPPKSMNSPIAGFLRLLRRTAGRGFKLLAPWCLGLSLFAVSAVQAQVSGAIFTTDATHSKADLNIYYDKADVYLNGGPAHPGAAGLPDSVPAGVPDYYVQVTTPDGDLLGKSTSAVVIVTGGEFDQLYQLVSIVKTASSGFTVFGYDDTDNPGGEYKVWVSKNPLFPPSESKTDNFKVKNLGDDEPIPLPAELCAEKFYDANVNGVFDGGDVLINGWVVTILNVDDNSTLLRYTPSCTNVEPGTYVVTESTPIETHWIATTDTSSDEITLAEGDHVTVQFGNVCIGAGGGKTLGFWSNKNGQKLFTAPDLALMISLNLRAASGSAFNPGSYSQFRTWLLNANATNMAYMLSAQLAAMELNVFNGLVNGNSLVYAPQLLPYAVPGLNPLGFISVNNLMTAANNELGLHGSTLSGSPFRAYQEALKNALDAGNNNLNFVQGAPRPFSFAIVP